MARTRRCLSRTGSTSICARLASRRIWLGVRFCIGPTRSRGWWKRRCGGTRFKYHMVGGFSFYDRAEIKDILSYMKLVQNTNDSMALGRVVNSPPRGIGKTTMETLERMALTTGISTWDAIGRAIEDRLLPARALTALAWIQAADRRCAGDAGDLGLRRSWRRMLGLQLPMERGRIRRFDPSAFEAASDGSDADRGVSSS